MKLETCRDLEVWQRAMDLVVAAYELTGGFPAAEKYGLTSQMQRSAVSIPANIAEGYARTHRGDYLHPLSAAKGSLAELEPHLTLVVRLKSAAREQVLDTWKPAQDVGQMLTKLIQSLDNDGIPETRTRK